MPTPGKIERADGRLRLQGKIRMYAEESPGSFIRLFYEKLVPESAVEWCKEEVNSHISWKKDVTLPAEGYRIRVTPERIIVGAGRWQRRWWKRLEGTRSFQTFGALQRLPDSCFVCRDGK